MKLNKKNYYTPSIDELFDGVLFERKDKKWQQEIFKVQDIDIFETRLKFVDEEDIESLGFEKYLISNNLIIFSKMSPSLNENKMIYLKFHSNYKVPTFSILLDSTTLIDKMIVKNKSELIWILNRLSLN